LLRRGKNAGFYSRDEVDSVQLTNIVERDEVLEAAASVFGRGTSGSSVPGV
jgi:hypothetical protein